MGEPNRDQALSDWLEGELPENQIPFLEEEVRRDPVFRAAAAESLATRRLLAQQRVPEGDFTEQVVGMLSREATDESLSDGVLERLRVRRRQQRILRSVVTAVAMAVMLVAGALLFAPSNVDERPSAPEQLAGEPPAEEADEGVDERVVPRPPIAVLTRAIDVEWQHRTRFQARLGEPIEPGWLRVKSGVAEVSLSSGATVTIEGPARLRVDSPMQVVSKFGRMTANCPPSAFGFTVRFHGGKVVDLGTEFALDSEPEGPTEVHVLNGEVVVSLTDTDENVLRERNLKGNSAVELSPDDQSIREIAFDSKPYSGMQRSALIRSQPIKLQFDLGHRAGLYEGTNSPAHAAGDMFGHEKAWTQIVGDQSGAFVMADGNMCPHPIRVDYGHGDGSIDWDATPEDPWGRVYSKAAGVFDTSLCQDHRPWDFDLGLRVSGLPKGTYRFYALCRSVRRPEAAYDVSFGINLDRQLAKARSIPRMEPMDEPAWIEGKTYAMGEVTVAGPDDWATFITRYSRERSLRSTPHHGRSVLLGLQIVQLDQANDPSNDETGDERE